MKGRALLQLEPLPTWKKIEDTLSGVSVTSGTSVSLFHVSYMFISCYVLYHDVSSDLTEMNIRRKT